jgi:Phosphotransferase enzyme family
MRTDRVRRHDGQVLEEPLKGGRNADEVVRVGDTVRRAQDPGSAFAARLLAYLESAAYPYAPRYLGVDDRGRDILTYIPGQTTDHPSQRADGAYARGALMLRALHDLTAGHPLAAGRECVVHGDAGPFNTIFTAGLPVAFIDWTSARPGDRLDDLGYMAWTWCIQAEGNVPVADQARHLRELRDAYGPVDPRTLLDAMIRSQDRIIAASKPMTRDARLSAARRAWAAEAVRWASADRDLLRASERVLLTALK